MTAEDPGSRPGLAERLRSNPRLALLLAGALLLLWLAWIVRPSYHGLAMLLYQYPLVTWIPLLLGALGAGAVLALPALMRRERSKGFRRAAILTAVAVCPLSWTFFMIMMPRWQGRALYTATDYLEGAGLPLTTQPRLLPKEAAEEYGNRDGMKQAHIVVEPRSGQLLWSAEEAPALIPRGPSKGIAVQPLDRIDGTLRRVRESFDPAASRVGPGSIRWRGYKRHYFTWIQDRVIVPQANGEVVALAPYVGYKGFPVRHPYLKGVYVYHQDGRLEDLSPEEARSRPELADSGRLFPEKLARRLAEAYGYKQGLFGPGSRTKVDDPEGNPQPYLTNLGDGRIKWVTVAHPASDESSVSAIFLTDGATGRTEVWHAPARVRLLSNQGAARLARGLDLEWERRVCCDSDGHSYTVWIRKVTESRPVFAGGRFYYLVSILTNQDYERTREPVERTVLVDARERRMVEVYNHDADGEADDRLRAYFERAGRRGP